MVLDQLCEVARVCWKWFQAAQQHGFISASNGEGSERKLSIYRPDAPNAPSKEELLVQMPREEQLSRRLAALLRHRAHAHNVQIREDGYTLLADVLALPIFAEGGFTVREVEELVAGKDEKKRFLMKTMNGELWIRANQGHTIRTVQDSKLLNPINRPDQVKCCVHGTYLFAWEGIMRDGGLSRMTRNHIHFAPRPPGADRVISGMRSDCEVAIYLDIVGAAAAGIKFFRSSNDVILTRGDERGMVSARHFDRAVRLSDSSLLWPLADSIDDTATNGTYVAAEAAGSPPSEGKLQGEADNGSSEEETVLLQRPQIG